MRLSEVANPARRRHWWWLPDLVLLAVLAYVAATRRREEEDFFTFLRQARPGWLGAALLVQLTTYPCDAALWYRVLTRAGVRTTVAGLARLSIMKLTFDQLIPTAGIGGSVLVARGLRREGAPRSVATASVLLTVVCSYLAQVVAVGASVLFLHSQRELSASVLWIAVACACVSVAIPLAILLLTRVRWNAVRWVRRIRGLSALLQAVSDASPRLLRNPQLLVEGSALQLLLLVLDAATLRILIAALGQSVSFGAAFASFVIASIAQNVSALPGGVGAFEASLIAMLTLGVGVPVHVALTATMLLRGFTLWLPLLPGFYLLRSMFRGERAP